MLAMLTLPPSVSELESLKASICEHCVKSHSKSHQHSIQDHKAGERRFAHERRE